MPILTVNDLSSNTVTISGLTLAHGRRTGYGGGGLGIWQGTVSLLHSRLSDNEAVAAGGGGCYIAGGMVSFDDVDIRSNKAAPEATYDGGGGGCYIHPKLANAQVTIANSTIANNQAPSTFGGGLTSTRASLTNSTTLNVTLTNTTVSGNMAAKGGGLNNFRGGALILTNSTISGNTTTYSGGGVLNQVGTLTATDSTISGNTTASLGGGLHNLTGTAALTNTTISGNTATQTDNGATGGGIFNSYGTVVLTASTVSGNSAAYGGGVENYSLTGRDTLTLTGSTVSGNTASGDGGGLENRVGTMSLSNSTVSGNTATYKGGGLLNSNSGTLTVTASTISGNVASDGGGLVNIGTLTLANSTVSGNAAGGLGGGLLNSNGGTLTVAASTISGNTADSDNNAYGTGGGIYRQGGTVNVSSSIVAGNHTGPNALNDCAVNTGTITSQGHNLWGDNATCPATGPGDQDLVTLGQTIAQVLNTTLADNGGPTKTHALVTGGPAIDHGDAAACAAAPVSGKDQRGFPRPSGAGCDSGAYESSGTPPAGVALTLAVVGGGQVTLAPPGTTSGGGTFPYAQNTVVSLTPQPQAGQTFVGWTVDGLYKGWASPLTITMDAAHTVEAIFAPTKAFPDVGSGRPDFTAITELASRATIRGYGDGTYGPDNGVQRAEMAALIARATPNGPGTPTNGTLAPPACLVAGSWDCEDWGNGFSDRNGLDANLWRNVGALQHYQVAFGYDGAACAARGVASPCYGPTAPVSYVETVVFITRAMVAKGYWQQQPGAPQPYAGVPAVFGPTVATYQFYTAGAGGVQAPPSDWNAGATRGWFARALWQALNTYWGTDGQLPDGRNAGGFVP